MRKFNGALAASAVAIAALTTPAAADWNMAVSYSDSYFHTLNAKRFAERVAELTDGEIEIAVHSGQTLFKMPEVKRAVQTGQIPIGEFYLAAYGNEDPLFELDAIPFLAPGYAGAEKIWSVQKAPLTEMLAEQNLTVLYAVPFPGQNLYSNAPITTAEDLKGLKFRSQNSVVAKLADAVGATPVTIQTPEVPQAFATGVVEGMLTSVSFGATSKAWEYTNHLTLVDAMLPKIVVVANSRILAGLDDGVREAVIKAGAEAEERGWSMSRADAAKSLAVIRESKMTVGAPSEQLTSDMQAIAGDLKAAWVDRAGDDGAAIIAAIAE